MELNEKIKYYRERNNISKSELARQIGVSPSYITKLEKGDKSNPSIEILLKISNVLKIDINELSDTKNKFDILSNIFTGINKNTDLSEENIEEDEFLYEMLTIEELLIEYGYLVEHTKENKIKIMDSCKNLILLIDETEFVNRGKELLLQIKEFNELIIKQWMRLNIE